MIYKGLCLHFLVEPNSGKTEIHQWRRGGSAAQVSGPSLAGPHHKEQQLRHCFLFPPQLPALSTTSPLLPWPLFDPSPSLKPEELSLPTPNCPPAPEAGWKLSKPSPTAEEMGEGNTGLGVGGRGAADAPCLQPITTGTSPSWSPPLSYLFLSPC